MAGYSQTPLVKKLGLKPGYRALLINAPKGFARELEPLPPEIKFVSTGTKTQLDFILFFVDSAKTLLKQLPGLKERLVSDGMLWVAWPKKSSGVPTDMNFDIVQQTGLKIGLVDVKICAVNDIWSGLKFVYRLRDRK